MVKTKKVKLGVTSLLSFQDYLKLSPLLTYKVGRPLDDVMGLDGCRLQKSKEHEHVCFKLYTFLGLCKVFNWKKKTESFLVETLLKLKQK